MGATWTVKVVPASGALGTEEGQRLDRLIRDDLARIDQLMSTWDPESELSRFNQSQSTEPFAVSPETFEVFRWSVELARITDGALDVTVAPLVEAWGFGAAVGTERQPDEQTLARLRESAGMHLLELDPAGQWVRKRRPEVRVDFSAIAPGYAADRLAAIVAGQGFADFLVDVGGELVARGRNERGDRWQIAVERPDPRGRAIQQIVPISDSAVATSGDYRNFREVNGERVTHILDPRTGRPIRHRLASVTVLDAQGVRADGLATALMALGPDDGRALAERLDLAVLFLIRNPSGSIDAWMSPAFEARQGDP
jgi:FAD:protein FMN transferase